MTPADRNALIGSMFFVVSIIGAAIALAYELKRGRR